MKKSVTALCLAVFLIMMTVVMSLLFKQWHVDKYEEMSDIPTVETTDNGTYRVHGEFVGPGGKIIVIANREMVTSIDVNARVVESVSAGSPTLIKFDERPYRESGTNGFRGLLVISTDPSGKKTVREFRFSEFGQ